MIWYIYSTELELEKVRNGIDTMVIWGGNDHEDDHDRDIIYRLSAYFWRIRILNFLHILKSDMFKARITYGLTVWPEIGCSGLSTKVADARDAIACGPVPGDRSARECE